LLFGANLKKSIFEKNLNFGAKTPTLPLLAQKILSFSSFLSRLWSDFQKQGKNF